MVFYVLSRKLHRYLNCQNFGTFIFNFIGEELLVIVLVKIYVKFRKNTCLPRIFLQTIILFDHSLQGDFPCKPLPMFEDII